jgi:hypothetical protein
MKLSNPVIVVVAYNRLNSLTRLLSSLKNAKYNLNVKLIISIDKGNNKEVLEYANIFEWNYGEKEVIYQKENLGLKKHILKCGDLTKIYTSIILLEDDLYVSPYFYEYATQSIDFYYEDNNISQISLYSYPINNFTKDKFEVFNDASDNYFLKVASSWGQIWTNKQWIKFREWFKENDLSISKNDNLPDFVIKWKETSWLKYFIKYNQEKNKYVVYPKVSLTSNFSDAGTNNPLNEIYLYQTNLMMEEKEYKFKKLDSSKAIYDVYFELDTLISNSFINEYEDIEFDLYGSKRLSKIKSKYLVSIKSCKKPIETYGLVMKPHELNIRNKIEGKDISFGLTSNFVDNIPNNINQKKFKYYWTHTPTYIDLFHIFLHRTNHKFINLKNKIKRYINK